MMLNCTNKNETLNVEVYETSASGKNLEKVLEFPSVETTNTITLNPEKTFQTITGFGGAFTESSAYLLNRLSKKNRNKNLLHN